jgi:transcriptional antiterminator RfaH
MRSKLNRMMASSIKHRVAPYPTKQIRQLKFLDRTSILYPAPPAQDWLLVMVAPRREAEAITSLREAGYIAWHPQMIVEINNARHRIRTRLNRPLFPRYVFVAPQDTASKGIKQCDHVTYIVGAVGSPRLLQALSERQTGGEFNILRPSSPWKLGDTVEIEEGPFTGLAGIVQKTDAERTIILLQMFGSAHSVRVGTVDLRKCA